MKTYLKIAFGMSLGLLALGCEADKQTFEPAMLAQHTATRSRDIVSNLGRSLAFVEVENSFAQRVGRSVVDSPLRRGSGTVVTQPLVLGMTKTVPPLRAVFGHPERRATLAGHLVYQSLDTGGGLEQTTDDVSNDLEVLLRDRILTPANLESSDSDSATYLLKPNPTCLPLPSEMSDTPNTPEPTCAEDLMKLEVRVVLSADGDGSRLGILIGMQKAELIAIIVHSNELAIEVSLADAKRAYDIADAALGDRMAAMTGTSMLKTFMGKVRLSVRKDGDKKVTVSNAILDALAIDVANPEGQVTMSFRSEARTPLFSFTADGVQKSITAQQNVGKTEIGTVWDPKDMGLANTDLKIVLGGFTGSTTLKENSEELTFDNVGLGSQTTSVNVRSQRILAVDFNSSDGRTMDVTIALNAADEPVARIAPKFDLSVLFNFNAIASDLDSAPDPIIANETYRLLLDGANPVIVESVPEDPTKQWKGGIKLTAGKLKLSAQTAAASLDVAQGQCMVAKSAMDTEHAIVGSFAAVACPQ